MYSFISPLESPKVTRLATQPPQTRKTGWSSSFLLSAGLKLVPGQSDLHTLLPYHGNNHICFQIINCELSFSPYQKSSLHLVVVPLSPIPSPSPQNTDGSVLPSWGCPQVKILFCPCKNPIFANVVRSSWQNIGSVPSNSSWSIKTQASYLGLALG